MKSDGFSAVRCNIWFKTQTLWVTWRWWLGLDFLLCLFSDREQKDPVYLRDKVSQKHSKEQFEVAQKIEQEYSKFFTGRYIAMTAPFSSLYAWTSGESSIVNPPFSLLLQVLSRAAPYPTFALRSWLLWIRNRVKSSGLPMAAPRGQRAPLHSQLRLTSTCKR